MGFIHETAHRCRRAERRIETPQHRRPVIDRNRRAKTAGMFAGRYRFAQHGLAVDSARNGPPAHCGICTRPQWQHQTHCQRPSRLSHPDDPTNGQPHAHGRATVQQHSHLGQIPHQVTRGYRNDHCVGQRLIASPLRLRERIALHLTWHQAASWGCRSRPYSGDFSRVAPFR